MPGVQLDAPQGAFYVMPEVSAFVGPGVTAAGFGPVPDVDALCRHGRPSGRGAVQQWRCPGGSRRSADPRLPPARPHPPVHYSLPPASLACRYLVEKASVALVPGDAFGAPDCIRISYAASMETLAKALDRLEAALAPANFTRE